MSLDKKKNKNLLVLNVKLVKRMFRSAVNPLFCYFFNSILSKNAHIYIYKPKVMRKRWKGKDKKEKNTKCVKAYYICYGPMANLRFKNNESKVWFLKIILKNNFRDQFLKITFLCFIE